MTAPTAAPPQTLPWSLTDPRSPAYRCRAYEAQAKRWKMCRDLRAGTDAMRAEETRYLAKNALERPDEYQERLGEAEFFNGFDRTTHGFAGMVFRRPPTLAKEADPALLEDWENINGSGTAGDVFARQVFEDALGQGHTFVFVDKPPVAGPIDLATEQAQQIRPYWVHYKPEQVISWRTMVRGGVTVLKQVVFEECGLEEAGDFGEQDVTRYRVVKVGAVAGRPAGTPATVITWALWEKRKTDDGDQCVWIDGGTFAGVTSIPLVCIYAGERLGWFHTKPPLLDLAFTNVAWYQVAADYRYSMHRTAIEVPYFVGRDTKQPLQAIGLNVGIDLPQGGSAGYLSATGNGLQAMRTKLEDLKQDMATQGLAMLQRQNRQLETATASAIDKSESDSQLAAAARALEDGLDELLEYHAAFRQVEPAEVSLNAEYAAIALDAQTITAWGNEVAGNRISRETYWMILQAGNALPKDFDAKVEEQRIADEMLPAPDMTPPRDPAAAAGDGGDGTGDSAPPAQAPQPVVPAPAIGVTS